MRKLLFASLVFLFSCSEQPKEYEEIKNSLATIDSLKAIEHNDTLLNKRLLMLENGFKTAHNELMTSESDEDRKATLEKKSKLEGELFITLHQMEAANE